MDNVRVKYRNGWRVILFLYFIILCILKYFKNKQLVDERIVSVVAAIFILLLLGTITICIISSITKYFTISVKNIKSCGDKLFDELDYYNRHWGKSNEYYQNMINAVKFYYKPGGKVETVIGDDLHRLYNRVEFLKRALSTKEHLNTCVMSVGLSVCATLFFEYFYRTNENETWYMIAFSVIFLAVLLFRYFVPFHEGSTQIYEYELRLLNKRITYVETKVSEDF